MTKRDNLSSLIKSLSKSEKRHFKLFVSRQRGSKNYLKLFDMINAQKYYSEELIKKRFSNEPFINQIHVTKNYLYKLILKSLRNYHSGFSKDAELKNLLLNAEILFTKEKFSLCEEELNRAGKMALKYEKLSILLQILSLKKKLLFATAAPPESDGQLSEIIRQEEATLSLKKNQVDHWKAVSKMTAVIQNELKWEDVVKGDGLLDIQSSDTLQARTLKHHILYSHKVTTGKTGEAIELIDKLIDFLENYPERIEDEPGSYITALNNKIGLLVSLKKLDAVPEILKKIKSVPEKYKLKAKSNISVKLYLRTYNIELELLRDTHQFDKALELIEEVQDYIKDAPSVPPVYRLLFYYQFAYVNIMKKRYTNALKWTNEIVNTSFGTLREDIQSYTRFLNLMIHFELKNSFVLKYSVESCRRFLRKKRKLHDFEKVLLNFFSKASTSLPEKHESLFRKLKQDLFKNTETSLKTAVLDYLDFESWINEKLLFGNKALTKK